MRERRHVQRANTAIDMQNISAYLHGCRRGILARAVLCDAMPPCRFAGQYFNESIKSTDGGSTVYAVIVLNYFPVFAVDSGDELR